MAAAEAALVSSLVGKPVAEDVAGTELALAAAEAAAMVVVLVAAEEAAGMGRAQTEESTATTCSSERQRTQTNRTRTPTSQCRNPACSRLREDHRSRGTNRFGRCNSTSSRFHRRRVGRERGTVR